MAVLLGDTPARVLAVYAHPDDAEVSCGGTLARWAAAGAEVHLVVCTTGDKGTTDPAIDPQALVARRADETAAAADALGLSGWECLGLPDGEVEDTATLRGTLVARIRRVRPDTLLCPDPTALLFGDRYVNHRDHRVAGTVALDAVSPAAARPAYFPAAGPPHQVGRVLLSGTLQPTVWVDIAAGIDAKVAAVACHGSQLAGGDAWAAAAVRARAEEDGRRAGVSVAEGFRLVQLDG